jgi:hypothetical protein
MIKCFRSSEVTGAHRNRSAVFRRGQPNTVIEIDVLQASSRTFSAKRPFGRADLVDHATLGEVVDQRRRAGREVLGHRKTRTLFVVLF